MAAFASCNFSRYNRVALVPLPHLRPFLFLFLAATCIWVSSCAVALGPSYTVDRQEIHVQFESGPPPKIRIDCDFELRNTGTRPLASLELRLPAHRRFRVAASRAAWDSASLAEQASPVNPRNTLLALPERWNVSDRHTLHISTELETPPAGGSGFSFASDAFFLPSEGWAPELLPPQGLFATGGNPPTQWPLRVSVPSEFLVHTSGRIAKTSRNRREITMLAVQRRQDRYPFVIAGLYRETALSAGAANLLLWTHAPQETPQLQQSTAALVRAIQVYNATFGLRARNTQPFWIVQCPALVGCFTSTESAYANLLNADPAAVSSQLASFDTLMIDFSGGPPKLAAVAPSLAASWLGYGENPGFYEQRFPLSALPAFASAVGEESIGGPSSRSETIRRALRMIPKDSPARKTEDESVLRAKSFLFFFALEERYGKVAFDHAINHMLAARQGSGFDLDDLIAAFEEETHQNVAEFERLWMKRPGVPDEFRARYENSSASLAINSKETMP
jgi:hypothetical protein